MVQVEIQGAEQLAGKLKNLPGNIDFATSKAINDTAVAVQDFEVRSQLPDRLTLRSRGTPWTTPGSKFGINIRPFASKNSLTATIGSQADWLLLQETGGTKTASGHRLAIATPFWRRPNEIMERSKKPAAILRTGTIRRRQPANGQPRVIRPQAPRRPRTRKVAANRPRSGLEKRPWVYEGRKMPPGIYVRTGNPRLPIKMLFKFQASAPIKPVLEFFESGRVVAEAEFPGLFHRRFAEVLTTAKLA